MSMEPNESLAYVAGFVDGEGCIRIASSRRGPSQVTLHIVNSNQRVISYINALFPGRVYNQKRYGRKNLYRVHWSGETAILVIELIYPYLIVKREIARLVVEYWYKFFAYEEVDASDLDSIATESYSRSGALSDAEIILRNSYLDKVSKLIKGDL